MSEIFTAIATYEPMHEDEMQLSIESQTNETEPAFNPSKRQSSLFRPDKEDVQKSQEKDSKVVKDRVSWINVDDLVAKTKEITLDPETQPALLEAEKNGLEKVDPKTKLERIKEWKSSRANTLPANIGCLRIAVFGDTGIGKSSLITALSNTSDISSKSELPTTTQKTFKETACSTIPPDQLYSYEEPLNLTFVESSGYSNHPDSALTIRPCIEHLSTQFQITDKIFQKGMNSLTLMRLLGGGSGSHTHIDVCLYAILHRLKPIDIEYMRVLSTFTQIVPIIIKSDSLLPHEVYQLKLSILKGLQKANIQIFKFGLTADELIMLAEEEHAGAVPFAVSVVSQEKAAVNDFEALRQSLFYSFVDDLRNGTAEKFVGWRNGGHAKQNNK